MNDLIMGKMNFFNYQEIDDAFHLGKDMNLTQEEILNEIKAQGIKQSQIDKYLSQNPQIETEDNQADSEIDIQSIKQEITKVKAWIADEEKAQDVYSNHEPLDPEFEDIFEDASDDESRHSKRFKKYLKALEQRLNN